MTFQELHIGVNLGAQQIASNVYDDFLKEEVDYFLNEAVKDYIKEQYSQLKNENRDMKSQFVNENLRTLITNVSLANISAVSYIPNAAQADLPADYLYYIFSRLEFNGEWKNCRKLGSKGIKDYVETDYNKPIFREFPLLIENDSVIVIGDSLNSLDNTTDIRFTYLKSPMKISLEGNESTEFTSLPEHTHQEVVNLAVRKILTIIGSQQTQTE